jgi:ankyrin repeat protein
MLVALAWSSLAFCGEIHDAAASGDLEKVTVLLKNNPDLVSSKDNTGKTPLHWAAYKGYTNVAELLLANKADVNALDDEGDTPLHEAAYEGYDIQVKGPTGQIIKAVDGNFFPGAVTVALAPGSNPINMVKLLISNKAEVNAKDNDGCTPLHKAASSANKDVVKVLLSNHADVNAKDNDGNTPLDYAKQGQDSAKDLGTEKNYEAMEELLRHPPDTNPDGLQPVRHE